MTTVLKTLMTLALASAGTMALGAAAQAEDTVSIVLSGEAYDGPPAYRLQVGNEATSGRVRQAIDAQADGRLPLPVPAQYRRTVDFTTDSLADAEAITLSFTNDIDEPAVGGRSLALVAAFINDHEVPLSDFSRVSGNIAVMRDGALVLSRNGTIGIMPTPFGWEGTDAYTAASIAAARNSCMMDGSECPASITVSFDSANEADFTGVAASEIAAMVAEVQERACTVRVVGYASTGGSEAFNQELSEARAATVASALEDAGVTRIRSRGAGETDRFGTRQSDNRVAVVSTAACLPKM